jgi:hypothetical protein
MFKIQSRILFILAVAVSLGGCETHTAQPESAYWRRAPAREYDRQPHFAGAPRSRIAQADTPRTSTATRPIRVAAKHKSDIVADVQDDKPKAEVAAKAQVQPAPVEPRAAATVETKPAEMKVAAAPITPLPADPAQPDTRPTAEARRGGGPAPVALAPVAPAPKASEQVSVAAPAPKVDDKTREMLKLVDVWLRQNNISNARTTLVDAVKSENPDLLNALAGTYDPVALQKYPKLVGHADVEYAQSFYALAIAKGSVEAKEGLAKMQAYLGKK